VYFTAFEGKNSLSTRQDPTPVVEKDERHEQFSKNPSRRAVGVDALSKQRTESDRRTISETIDDGGLDPEKLAPGRRRVTKLFEWLLPVERAVLTFSELEAADVQAGHSISEIGLPVSEATILAFVEDVEILVENKSKNSNEDLHDKIRQLRIRRYGLVNAEAIEKLELSRLGSD
jgi:hypothetical protein